MVRNWTWPSRGDEVKAIELDFFPLPDDVVPDTGCKPDLS